MFTSDQKKKRLFKKSKPFIRPFSMDDLWVFWAAYKEGSFDIPPDMGKDMFYEWLLESLSKHSSTLVVEDYNRRFKEKRGIVCVISIDSEGCRIEPKAQFFKWATKSNILRANVRFFNWVRYSKQVGVCVVRCFADTVGLFHHVKNYGVIYYVGKIVGGDPQGRGDEFVFSTRGKFVQEKS